MSQQFLTEAFNDCLDRIARGQSLEECLELYPTIAPELRDLLEITVATRQTQADTSELFQMRTRLDAQMDALIDKTNFDNPPSFRLPRGLTVLVASLFITTALIALFLVNQEIDVAGEDTPTAVITETITPSPIPTMQTATSVVTPTITVEITATPTIVVIPPLTEEADSENCQIPEGWFAYRIQGGDTLSFIALQSGSTVEALRQANCLEVGSFIVQGTIIYVPQLWGDNDDSSSGSNGGSGSSGSSDDNDDDDDGSNSGSSDDNDDDEDRSGSNSGSSDDNDDNDDD